MKLVWDDPATNLSLHATAVAPGALTDLLHRTAWGTRDVRYAIEGIDRILARIKQPHFLLLRKADHLIGAVVASRKSVWSGHQIYDALFIAMIAVEPTMTGSGYGTLLAAKAREYGRALLGEPGIIYLYVETTNTASIRVHEKIGYQRIGQFEARLFTRFFPTDNPAVTRPNHSERCRLADLLEHQYVGHELLDAHEAVHKGRFFVRRVQGEMVAAAQVRPMHWSLKKLRGFGGAMAMNVLPKLPLIRRGYSPEHFRFVVIGNIWVRAGHENALRRLLEALLARCRVHVGMIFIDKRSPVHAAILCNLHWDPLSHLILETAEVFVDLKGWTGEERCRLLTGPINVSTVDPM